MRIDSRLFLAALLCAAPLSTASAQGAPSRHVNVLVEILNENRCSLDIDPLELAFSKRLSREGADYQDLEVALFTLGAEGGVVVNEDTDIAQLYSEACGNAGENPFLRFVGVMAQNSCVMSEDTAEVVLTAARFEKDEIGFMVEAMMHMGKATVENDVLRISPPLCVAK